MRNFLIILALLVLTVKIDFDEGLLPVYISGKDYPVFFNGECVQHKFAKQIKYAISGKSGTYYDLVVWSIPEENSLGTPLSMVIGHPATSSEVYMGKFFDKIDCNPHPMAFRMTIYEDSFDYYDVHDTRYTRYY